MRLRILALGAPVLAGALLFGSHTTSAVGSAPVTLLAGGDVSLSRAIGGAIRTHHDPRYPVRGIATRFAAADIAFVNLEAPFSDRGPITPTTDILNFKNEPATVAALTATGLDVVSGANNHFRNAGEYGVTYSAQLLQRSGVQLAGAGANDIAAHAPRFVERRGTRFAFLAYGYPNDGTVAARNRAGIATAQDVGRMQADVRAAKLKADVVIVSLHAGTEYTRTPTAFQLRFDHAAIDAGATLVLGHHPHWVQPVERYRNGAIVYSLGNLVFDQPWSWETQHGIVAEVTFVGSRLRRVHLLPVTIDRGLQPRFVGGPSGASILRRLGITDPDLRFE